MRFRIATNIFRTSEENRLPGDENLRIIFDDHSKSPVSCVAYDTPELEALRSLLNAEFPGTRNYVLTHGSDCELSPGIDYTVPAYRAAAALLRPKVKSTLNAFGHQYYELEIVA